MIQATSRAATVLLAICACLLAASARAATGTLDTGALTPQTSSSRVAAEVENTGAAEQQGHEARRSGPPAYARVPQESGEHAPSKAGMERPNQ